MGLMGKTRRRLLTVLMIVAVGLASLAYWLNHELRYIRHAMSTELPPAALLDAPRGISRAELEQLYQRTGRHQATALVEQETVLCVSYTFGEPYVTYYFVFRNDRLTKIIEPPRGELRTVPYRGSRRVVPTPVDADLRLRAVLASPDLSRDALGSSLEQRLPKAGSESFNVLSLLVPFIAVKSPWIAQQYRHNAALMTTYDGLRIEIGMDTDEVDVRLGSPKRIHALSDDREVCVYGDNSQPDVNPMYQFSWVAVVFDDGRAVRLFSHHFFDERLRTGPRLSPARN